MKPFQIIILAIFGFLALIGLLVFAGGGSSNRGNNIGEVVVWGVLPREEVNTVLNEIRNYRDDFDRISYVEVGEEQFYSAYVEAVAAGRGPDLILIPHELLRQTAPSLATISFDTYPLRDFTDTFVDGGSIVISQNGYYGVPVGIDPLIMYYNRSMFNTARITQAPQYWEQFIGLVPRITERGPGSTLEKSFVALGAYNNITHAAKILGNFFFQVDVPMTDNSGRITFDEKGSSSVALGESALRFYTGFANPNTSAYSWNAGIDSDRQAFLRGDLAIYFAPASEAEELHLANPNLSFGTAAFPQLEEGAPVTYGSIYLLAAPRGGGNVTGALTAALAFIAKNEAALLSTYADFAPVRRDLLAEAQTDPVRDLAYEAALISRGWFSPQPGALNDAFSAMVEDVVSGRLNASDAISKAARALR